MWGVEGVAGTHVCSGVGRHAVIDVETTSFALDQMTERRARGSMLPTCRLLRRVAFAHDAAVWQP